MTKQPCLQAENEQLRTGYAAARLEIESLKERVQQLGKAARDVNSRRVQELEAQLEAIGAGGVEPLRKRCLHQISEPDHFRGATEMVTAARQPLDDKAILQGRTDGYDAEDPPEGWAFAQGVRFAERAHGIKGEPQ